MIAQTLSLLVLVAVAAASSAEDSSPIFRPLEGVDPNTVSCDPAGEIFLLLPHFNDTNKFFMCAHGEEVLFHCAFGGLCFDFELQTCTWESSFNKCTLRTPKDDNDLEGSGMDSGDEILGLYGEENENGPIALLTAESSGTVRPRSAVASQAFNGVLNCNRADSASRQVPYKGDCQRYWKCVSGAPQVAYCTDGLFFNEHAQQCDFEANSRCADQPNDELRGEFIVYE